MKKLIIVCALATAFAMMFAAPAFAAWGDSALIQWDDAVDGLHEGEASPHGDYDTTTYKCGVCHAVHAAASGGQKLLPAPVSTACDYCHVDLSGAGYVQVYGGVSTNHTTGSTFAHNNDCTACHQVHGAADDMSTFSGGASYKILMDVTNVTDRGGVDYTAYSADPATGDTNADESMSKWCSQCHPYYNTSVNGLTHVMKADETAYAFVDSTYCVSCHDSTYTTPQALLDEGFDVGAGFPHITDGSRFLTDDAGDPVAAGASNSDGPCLSCHSDGVTGIGLDQ